MKSYYRYEPSKILGVISTPRCNAIFDYSGNLCLSGALQDINIISIKQGTQIASIADSEPNYPYSRNGETTVLHRGPGHSAVAGYSSGELRVLQVPNRELRATLRGHSAAVLCLAFSHDALHSATNKNLNSNNNSELMASGGLDNDISVWDLVSLTGLCRLRGHKDAVTGLSFLQYNNHNNNKLLLVSVSKDSLLKVWDLTTYNCIQTIVGHRCEIYSVLTVYYNNNNNEKDNEIRIFTGAADDQIRCYKVNWNNNNNNNNTENDKNEILEYYGSIVRGNGVNAAVTTEKCIGLYVNPSNSLLMVQSAGKWIEFYYIRSDEEIHKKYKRRCKRLREKLNNNINNINNEKDDDNNESISKNNIKSKNIWADDEIIDINKSNNNNNNNNNNNINEKSIDNTNINITDELNYLGYIRCNHKIRGVDFDINEKISVSNDNNKLIKNNTNNKNNITTITNRILISLNNNIILFYEISFKQQLSSSHKEPILFSNELQINKTTSLEISGHRTDIRGICIGSDNNLLVTCSTDEIKCWNKKNYACTKTCTVEYFCLCIELIPGDRYCIVGTKEGHLIMIDVFTGDIIETLENAHNGAIWSIVIRPDSKGFMTGSADKDVKFWDINLINNKITFKLSRQLQMSHDVLCVRYSNTIKADKLLLAVGLLDYTVKVFHDDSIKFFLSLYGHKAPIMSIDISYDNTILISGSADKTIKIWGLDFGDCHRSLIAHEDSVTCVRFQPKTHFFFSSSKDGSIKYWDADRFEQILYLPGHTSGIWSLNVSSDSSFITSVGQDRSIRIWERNLNDLVFVEEEKELAMEAMVTSSIEKQQKSNDQQIILTNDGGIINNENNDKNTNIIATHIDVVKGGEKLMETIDLVEKELIEIQEKELNSNLKFTANPLFLGMNPYHYLIHILHTTIKSSELESTLLLLPFHYVIKFIPFLTIICKLQLDIELTIRCIIFLLRSHLPRIINTNILYTDMIELKIALKESLSSYRNIIGTNIAALQFLSKRIHENSESIVTINNINNNDNNNNNNNKNKKNKKQKLKI